MKEFTTQEGHGFVWERNHERVWVMPWGKNGVRVRITREAKFLDVPQGLLDNPVTPGGTRVVINNSSVELVNGAVTVSLTDRLGQLTFNRTSDGATVLQERQ